ncbi:hypothetical protein AB0K93_29270 [Streptomyces sp. NPDC052676]|uniref:hypothetical protein n=1 Tax=Streptomyces sp. NPDC052676 TaxID=3154953 RepID=UPI003441BE25
MRARHAVLTPAPLGVLCVPAHAANARDIGHDTRDIGHDTRATRDISRATLPANDGGTPALHGTVDSAEAADRAVARGAGGAGRIR